MYLTFLHSRRCGVEMCPSVRGNVAFPWKKIRYSFAFERLVLVCWHSRSSWCRTVPRLSMFCLWKHGGMEHEDVSSSCCNTLHWKRQWHRVCGVLLRSNWIKSVSAGRVQNLPTSSVTGSRCGPNGLTRNLPGGKVRDLFWPRSEMSAPSGRWLPRACGCENQSLSNTFPFDVVPSPSATRPPMMRKYSFVLFSTKISPSN